MNINDTYVYATRDGVIFLKEFDNATEWCSACDCETQMQTMVQRCNLCGEWQVCCSMCDDYSKCDECILNKLVQELNKLDKETQ